MYIFLFSFLVKTSLIKAKRTLGDGIYKSRYSWYRWIDHGVRQFFISGPLLFHLLLPCCSTFIFLLHLSLYILVGWKTGPAAAEVDLCDVRGKDVGGQRANDSLTAVSSLWEDQAKQNMLGFSCQVGQTAFQLLASQTNGFITFWFFGFLFICF